MKRYPPGVYTIYNRYAFGSSSNFVYHLDNSRFSLQGDSALTVIVYNNLLIPDGYIDANRDVRKVADINSAVIGNINYGS